MTTPEINTAASDLARAKKLATAAVRLRPLPAQAVTFKAEEADDVVEYLRKCDIDCAIFNRSSIALFGQKTVQIFSPSDVLIHLQGVVVEIINKEEYQLRYELQPEEPEEPVQR